MPFAYAVGAMWRRDLTGWIKPVLPWAFFAVGILGAGILMGGAWAYEALSFGGFWAWDPVENSSLVPWMVLVAAAHLLLINRNRKKPTALFSTVYLSVLAFLLVLYSTFLDEERRPWRHVGAQFRGQWHLAAAPRLPAFFCGLGPPHVA